MSQLRTPVARIGQLTATSKSTGLVDELIRKGMPLKHYKEYLEASRKNQGKSIGVDEYLQKKLGKENLEEIRENTDSIFAELQQSPSPSPSPLKESNTMPHKGGSRKHTYKNRSYTVHTGERGGKYILVKNKKVYI